MTTPPSAPPPAPPPVPPPGPNRYDTKTMVLTTVVVGLAGPLFGLLALAVDNSLPLLVFTLALLPILLVVGIVFVASAKTVRRRSIGLGLVIGFGIGLLLTGGTCAVVLGQVGG